MNEFVRQLQAKMAERNLDINKLSAYSGLTMLELELLQKKEVKMLECRAERLARVLGGGAGYWIKLYKED